MLSETAPFVSLSFETILVILAPENTWVFWGDGLQQWRFRASLPVFKKCNKCCTVQFWMLHKVRWHESSWGSRVSWGPPSNYIPSMNIEKISFGEHAFSIVVFVAWKFWVSMEPAIAHCILPCWAPLVLRQCRLQALLHAGDTAAGGDGGGLGVQSLLYVFASQGPMWSNRVHYFAKP